MILKLAGALAALATLTVSAADVAAHKARMDDAQNLSYDLKDALDAKDPVKAAEVDTQLTRLLEAEQAYWAKTELETPVNLALGNSDAAKVLADRVAVADWPGAEASYARLQAQCRNCHDLHPEKSVRVSP
jgi:hypothetical protein